MYLYNCLSSPVPPQADQLNLSTEISPKRQYIFAEIKTAQKKVHKENNFYTLFSEPSDIQKWWFGIKIIFF
jgi:hypothetical protein